MRKYVRKQDGKVEQFPDNETQRKIDKRLKFLGGDWNEVKQK
jgi:hypothetical protein